MSKKVQSASVLPGVLTETGTDIITSVQNNGAAETDIRSGSDNDTVRRRIKRLGTKQIKTALQRAKISDKGNRDEVMHRLEEYQKSLAYAGSHSESDTVIESEYETTVSSRKKRSTYRQQTFFTFQDVENTIKKFSGENLYPIEKWIQDFEEQSVIMNWNDLQMFVYAKRCLIGTALLAIQCNSPRSWTELVDTLMNEFSTKVSSAEVHQLLSTTKKEHHESYLSYTLRMKEIAKSAAVDDTSLIHYIINGIQDRNENKMLLYGAKDINELKQKLKVYYEFKASSSKQVSNQKFSSDAAYKPPTTGNIKCSYCLKFGHIESDCRQKKLQCYKCNQTGHKARSCTATTMTATEPINTAAGATTREIPTPNTRRLQSSSSNRTYCNFNKVFGMLTKSVVLNNVNTSALIDTGSALTLIRKTIFMEINHRPVLSKDTYELIGIGNHIITTIGSAEIKIKIDDEEYAIVVHVVRDEDMIICMILGYDFLQTVRITMDMNGVVLSRFQQESQLEIQPETQAEIPPESQSAIMNIMIESDLEHQPEYIQKIIKEYQPKENVETCVETRIILTDDQPIFQNPRRLAPLEAKVVENQINEWLSKGIISNSNSNYASPIVMVKKKDETLRLCVDYRKLNKKIVMDRYPMPNMELIIDELHTANVYSTLDLENGFFHVPVEKESRRYTAFNCHLGIYEFNKTPFGLCLSPSSFARFINHVFRDLILQGIVLIYVDDLIIPSMDEHEGLIRLRKVLEVAAENGLNIKWSKCKFLQRRIEFLGLVIENGTIQPSPNKISAVSKFPEPTCQRQLQSFLGLTGFFRKFIFDYGKIAIPLTNMLKKNHQFHFGNVEKSAFESLKHALTSHPVLHIFIPDAYTELHTDASREGYGGILLQKSGVDQQLHPVCYMSRKTTDAEKNYSSYELEALAVIHAVKKFRVYLLGTQFLLVTDCKALTQTLEKKDILPRVARWAMTLQDYTFSVQHRSGNRMAHVDSLSRYPVMAINSVLSQRIKEEQEKDTRIKEIVSNIGTSNQTEYSVSNGILYRYSNGRHLLVVPDAISTGIIRQVHESNGHFLSEKLESIIKRDYDIIQLKDRMKLVIDSCVACLVADRKRGKVDGLLHCIPKEDQPLQTLHVDHLGPMTLTDKKYQYILVVIDGFSKFCWLYPTKSTTAKEVIDRLQQHQQIFGNPVRLITDRGTAFTANDFQTYCRDNNIQHLPVTTGVPRGNGQVERLNQCIISVLTKLSTAEPRKWYSHVQHLQIVLNSTHQKAINTTPFQVLIGTKMRRQEDEQILELLDKEILEHFSNQRIEIRNEAKEQIEKMQNENRKSYNRKAKPATQYLIGNLVFIKRTQFGTGLKIKGNFLGPYRVMKVLVNDRYEVEKIGSGEGPVKTTVSSDHMKLFKSALSEAYNEQDGRVGYLITEERQNNLTSTPPNTPMQQY